MKYLKVWTDFENVLEMLEEDEIGRLFIAMLHFAATGEEADLPGNERYVWPVAKRDILHTVEESVRLRENGLKQKSKKKQDEANGSNDKQDEANTTEQKQTEANGSQKEKKGNEIKEKEKKSSFIDDVDAHAITKEQNTVLDAAEMAGFQRNDATRAKLIDLYAIHGLKKVIDGIESCVDHGVCNIAYLTAVLKGEPRKQKISAQKYEQRDYSSEQDEAMMRMIRGAG